MNKYANGEPAKVNDPVIARVGNIVIAGDIKSIHGNHAIVAGQTVPVSDCFSATDALIACDAHYTRK